MFRQMRRFKQEVSKDECVRILQNEKRGVLAVTGDEGWPYAIPLDFYYDESEGKIYFHCAKEGHKTDAIQADSRVCFTVWDQGYQKEDWSYYVTCVVAFGRAEPVTDPAIKYEKAQALGCKYFPTEDEVVSELERNLDRAQIVSISIEHMTGKLVHER